MLNFKLPLITLWICLSVAHADGIDLHAHLFLEHGVPHWFYNGCFTCPLQAKDYSSLTGSKANEEELLKSKLDITVASIYAVSFGFRDLRESIRQQIQAARDFVLRHPDWIIARSSATAAAAIKYKKRVLVLSLEGADGILQREEDIQEFLIKSPIALVTPLHLTDDEFGGAAFLRSFHGFLNFSSFVRGIFDPIWVEDVRTNHVGLTEQGRWLIKKLIESRVWIDLAHASDKAQKEILSETAKLKLPLLYTHTSLREYHGAERGLAKWQIEEIKSKGGMVGLLPSRNYLNGTPQYECDIKAFFMQYRQIANQIGRNSVTIGSDFNAPIEHLAPGCGTYEGIDEEGFWRPDQISELWGAVNNFQVGLADPKGQLGQFLKLWARVR